MQEPTTLDPLLITPDPTPPIELSTSNFDALLFWQGAVPTVTLPFSIDNIKTTRNAYSNLVTIARSAQDQVESNFLNNPINIRDELQSRITSGIDAPSNLLESALQTKVIILELIRKLKSNKCWREAELFFGIDALSLESSERAELFAAYVDTLEEPSEGTSRGLYESFLSSLTAAYIKRSLVEAIAILEQESTTADAALVAAQAEAQRVGTTIRIPIGQSAHMATMAGTLGIQAANGLTLEAAILKGIKLLSGLGETLLSRATALGIGALLYSPALGNGERYPQTVLSLPGNALLPDLPSNLQELATVEGTVDLPYRIYGDHDQYTLVTTQVEGGVSAKVPVRTLAFDPTTNSYSFISSGTPPITLSFPIVQPGNSSTTLPVVPAKVPLYTGVTLTPLLVQPDPLPAAELPDFRDCIYCFPIESGLPPIYVVFNNPYQGANTRGKYSGRLFNPDTAGGPILELDWTSASVTPAGIDLVKLHIGRFKTSDANIIMINRLEKINRGELTITDIDKRFYTHELRELERFRSIGVPDHVDPNDEGVIWNNAHAATLEDYKLRDSFDLLYTPDAIEADNKQSEKEYKQLGEFK